MSIQQGEIPTKKLNTTDSQKHDTKSAETSENQNSPKNIARDSKRKKPTVNKVSKRGKWHTVRYAVKASTEIVWKFLILLLATRKLFFVVRVPLILTSEVTVEHFIHLFLHWLGIDEITLKILSVLLRIALVITFLISIRTEVRIIARTIKREFKIKEQKISLFLFLIFALIAYITLY
jgi:hypothetical protein